MTSDIHSSSSRDVQAADLAECDREPIHLLGRVQSFGFLVGVAPDWTISHASENSKAFLNRPASDLIGLPFEKIAPPETIHTIRNRLQYLVASEGTERVGGIALRDTGEVFDVMVHRSGETIVMEFEPMSRRDGNRDPVWIIQNVMNRLSKTSGMDEMFRKATRAIAHTTGFDKVMIYRFSEDGSGNVVAETSAPGMEKYLDLHFPATDIPKQARALYLRVPIRIISDVGDAGSPILSEPAPGGEPLDLSFSTLRSVSPVHLEYLRNMNVAASMSISIIVEGELWGLIACHNQTPKILDQPMRGALDLFGQTFSMLVTQRLTALEQALDDDVRQLTDRLTAAVSVSGTAVAAIMPVLVDFAYLIDADGLALIMKGNITINGHHPDENDIRKIVEYLNTATTGSVFATRQLAEHLPDAARFSEVSAGLMALPISRDPSDYVLFFRREIVQSINWAGNPDKLATLEADSGRLSPRKSFDSWKTLVEGQSDVWSTAQVRAAQQLRITLLEVVLRLTDEAARERKVAQDKQELLIAELNHRVRNILGLVRGLVNQTRSPDLSIADYVSVLDRRVQSLARAHDQITRVNWEASSFFDLLQAEIEAFLADKRDKITVDGDDYLLKPQAFSTLALVIHELVTNSMKYGSLSDSRGRITVSLSTTPARRLRIGWRELDGPQVGVPNRRGFGSVVVERSIPHELGGLAEVRFEPAGLMADFEIPEKYVERSAGREWLSQSDQEDEGSAPVPHHASPLENVLIVEDNLIIAMEAEDLFLRAGAVSVEIASNLDQALKLIEEIDFDLVLLDVNLDGTTSFPLAEKLVEQGIRVGFATGYGASIDYPDAVAHLPVISKPYDLASIEQLINDTVH